jgi:pyruvate formate lyase activating enzyme
VFLKGCPLSCLWCHNPESQSFKPELYYFGEKCVRCGLCRAACANHRVSETEHIINRADCNACGKCVAACPQSEHEIKGAATPAQDVIGIALKDARYYKQSGGGLTLSGGEPLVQFDFTQELLRLAKENALHTCLETSGYAPADRLLQLLPYVDLFLYDFKESEDEAHKKAAGVSRRLIMDNLFAIDKAGAKIVLRCPVIPAYNERDAHFSAIAATANALRNIIEVNIMPYHPMGASKAARIGREYPVSDKGFPADAQIDGWIQAGSRETKVTVKKG